MIRHSAARSLVVLVVTSLFVAGLPAGAAPRPARVGRETVVEPLATASPTSSSVPAAREVRALRTATSRTYVEADGGRRTELFTAPVHYRAGGAWRRIDNRLVPASRPGYAYENAAGPARVLLPPELGAAPVRVEDGRRWVAFALDGARGDAAVSARGARYSGALDGVTAGYEPVAGGVKETLTLSGPTSPRAFTFTLTASRGLVARATDDGGVELRDRRGRVSFTMPAPFMYDASGAVSHDVSLDVDGASLELVAGSAWLDAPSRAWPVVIDPTLVAKPAQRDCWIGNGTEVSSSNCGTNSDYIRVGYTGSAKRRGLVKFDLSSIPANATVTDANLALYLDATQTTTGRTAMYIVRRVLNGRPWTTPTWTKYDGVNAWTDPGGDFGGTDAGRNDLSGATSGYKHFDPTWLVQDWVSGRYENNGVILKQENETVDNVIYFVSSNTPDENKWPKLTVTYSEPVEPAFEKIGEREFYTYEEQRLNDHTELKVNVANGNLLVKQTDLTLKGTGVDFSVERYYNSLPATADSSTKLGWGWALGTAPTVRLEFPSTSGRVFFFGPSGYRVRFDRNAGGTWLAAEPGIHAELWHESSTNRYVVEWNDKQKYVFDSGGLLLEHKDKNKDQNVVRFTWTSDPISGQRVLDHVTDTHDRTIDFQYSGGLIDKIVDQAGGRTYDYSYDSAATPARLTSYAITTYGLGDDESVNLNRPTLYGYDTDGRLNRVTDPSGRVTQVTYVAGTRKVATVTRVDDDGPDPTTTFTYQSTMGADCDGEAKAVGETIVNGPRTDLPVDRDDKTTYCRDAHDRVVMTIDAKGHKRRTEYTSNSNVTEFNESGVVGGPGTGFTWTNDNLTKITLPTGGQASMGYGSAVNPHFPTSVRDYAAKGSTANTWDYRYDDNGNMFEAKNTPEGITFRYCYNADGTLSRLDQPPSLKNASGGDVVDDAEDADACAGLPQGNDTLFSYDSKGRLTRADPPGTDATQTFTYDAASRVKTVTDGRGNIQTYCYDALDRITDVHFTTVTPADCGSSSGTRVSYDHDASGNMLARHDATGTTNFTYDDLNRMTRESPTSGDPSNTTEYTYDTASNMRTMTVGDQPASVRYTYGPTNLVETITDQLNGVTRFEYDAKDLRTKTTYPNGTIMRAHYDDSKRIECIYSHPSTFPTVSSECPGPSSSWITYFEYDYTSPEGNDTNTRYAMTDRSGVKTNYRYDDVMRLETAIPTSGTSYRYTYDARGNMTQKTIATTSSAYTYNDANELVSGPGGVYTYDLAGNLSTGPGMAFTYNEKNQTTSVTRGTPTLDMTYADLTQDRRMSAGSLRFGYTQLNLSSQAPNSGVPHTSWFVRDPEQTLVSMLDRNDATKNLYYVFDGLGSVAATVDHNGVVKRYAYEPYGKEIAPSASDPNPWRFAAGYYDHDTRLLKFGTRYYDPELGRWTQRDPQFGRLEDPMSLNPYTYVGDNPVNTTDPTGRVAPMIPVIVGGLVGLGALLGAGALGSGPTLASFVSGCAGTAAGLMVAGPVTAGAVGLGCVIGGGLAALGSELFDSLF